MTATDTYVLLRAFVDELARCGLRAACTSPGSRSTPLVLSLVRQPRLRCFSHLDERCAGFFAVGLAQASRAPVALACTSGTAVVELAPAVYEAHQARLPLIVLTADRPPELRDKGAGQTIDQLKLYGDAVKWFVEVGVEEAAADRLRWIRTLACRAWWTAQEDRPGPVHLNFPLREPLVPDGPLPPPGDSEEERGRAGGRPWLTHPAVARRTPREVVDRLRDELVARPRGVIVAGRCGGDPRVPVLAARLAERSGSVLLADPLSHARRSPAAVAHYDALLRDGAFAASQSPDIVLRVGDLPTSKALRGWLSTQRNALQLRLDPESSWQDPADVVATALGGDPAALLDELAAGLRPPRRTPWRDAWHTADRAAAGAIAGALGSELSEPRVAAELGVRLPAHASVLLASSMPVRDAETFWPVRAEPPRALGLRGANGIDGTVSTAFGMAAAADGPAVLVTGDVALAYDVGGLLAARRLGLRLVVVALDNDGGGIFHFLPVHRERDAFEEHVATPHGLDFAHAAALYGLDYARAANPPAFRDALDGALASPGSTLIVVRSQRDENVAVHERVWAAVARAIAPLTR